MDEGTQERNSMSQDKEQKSGKGPQREVGKRTQGQGTPRPRRQPASAGKGTAPREKAGAAGERGKREKKPPKYTGKALIAYRSYIVLTVISAIIVAGYTMWSLFSAAPDPDGNGRHPDNTRAPIVTQYVDPDTGETIEEEIPGLPADRKREFYTFLLIGQSQDTGGKLSDTMMLAAYDVPNQTLSVMSLPRDTYVKYNGRLMLLNAVYNAAGGDRDGKGVAGLKQAVKDLTGIYPDFHVIIQWEALGELVDAIGGVYYEVPFDMYYNDLSQHFKIDLKKGYQLLDGEGAMGLVRWRHNSDNSGHISSTYGYAEGDIGRIKTQQAFLKEVIKKCLQMDTLLKNLGDYIGIFQRNVTTDLEIGHMAYFAKSALGGLDMENVKFETLPWYSAGNAHILPSGSQIVKSINNGYNPYKNDIRLGELRLATMDDVPRPSVSAAPVESEEPDDDPVESHEPSGSPKPSASPTVGEPILPPGVAATTRPSSSPKPSGQPAESGTPHPTESQPSAAPSATGEVEPTPAPPAVDTPAPTPPLAEPTQPPASEPDNEPLLPPGV